MILVFYIVSGIIFCSIITIISISKIELNIENLDMSNINKRENNKNIFIKVSMKIGKWHLIRLKADKEKIANIYVMIKKIEHRKKINKQKIKNMLKKEIKIILQNEELKKLILNTRCKLERLDTNFFLGTENPIFTSYLVAVIAILISNVIPHITYNKKYSRKIKYKVLPIYQQKNIYILKLNAVVNIKIIYLIRIAYKLHKLNKTKSDYYKYSNVDNQKKINV